VTELNARGGHAAVFLPARFPGIRTLNLRNHRKLGVIDGRIAFTGGMNISDGYAIAPPAAPIHDTAFRIGGPIVRDLQEVFAIDWMFTTGESLEGRRWFPVLERAGEVTARVLADGPDEDFELSRWVILGAIAAARQRIRIVTPYFVPDPTFVTALNVAALRGIDVQILIPEVLDHVVVKWASNALLWQVLEKGCRVFFTPPPFDHSKLFTVDGTWAFFGSSNWDARSIRLNFELNVEVFDATLTLALDSLIQSRYATAREVTLAEVDARSIPIRLRDGLARLLSPYL
jgi:cardiolipin synthase